MADIYESKSGVFQHIIRNFSLGMVDDKRIQAPGYVSVLKGFDAFTYQTKVMPYFKRITSNGQSGQPVTSMKLTRFLYAPSVGTAYRLFGLGDNGSGKLAVFKLDIDNNNLDIESWVVPGNNASASGVLNPNIFDYYKGFLYMYQGTTGIARFDVTEVAGFADSWNTIDNADSITLKVRPVHHPNDDIMYFFGENQVYSLNGVTYNGSVLTLPSDMQIAAACPFGNYLAIACVTKGNLNRHSIIYLWDRNSSITTLSERIDMGEGEIWQMANLNNRLVCVMKFYADNVYGLNTPKVLIKTPTKTVAAGTSTNGSSAAILREIEMDVIGIGAGSDFPYDFQVRNDKMYFAMRAKLNGDFRTGIWVVDENGKVSIDQYEPGADVTAGVIRGFFAAGNVWYIAYSDASGGAGAYSVTRTDVDSTYSTTVAAVIETLKLSTVYVTGRGVVIQNNNTTKKLIGVTIHTEPLPNSGQIVFKYRIDGATAWTTIFTFNTMGGSQHQAINIESSGANFPALYNEIEFRIESTGGAQICGMEYSGEVVPNNIY